MPKVIHYHHDGTIEQVPGGFLSLSDYTLNDGIVGDRVICCKNSKDDIYLLILNSSYAGIPKARLSKISKAGVILATKLFSDIEYSGSYSKYNKMMLSRDESTIYLTMSTLLDYGSNGIRLFTIPEDLSTDAEMYSTDLAFSFDIYQNRLVWVQKNTQLFVYGYLDKVLLSTIDSDWAASFISLHSSGSLYSVSAQSIFRRYWYDGSIIQSEIINQYILRASSFILVDKWGDLIVLGDNRYLSKYNTSGEIIGTEKDLGEVPIHNLNTSVSGDYYYSTASATYKIDRNMSQGQAFTSDGVKFQDTGLVTENNLITGYSCGVQC